jgi:sec-independent protein translocase protein TatA
MFRNPTTDLLILLAVVLLIFGPKRLPALGRQLGQGLREFKESITGENKEPAEESEVSQRAGEGGKPAGVIAPPRSEASSSGSTSDHESAEVGPTEPRS